MSYRDCAWKFPETNILRRLEVLENRIKNYNLKRQTSKDTENAPLVFKTEIANSKDELKDIKSKIKGFNKLVFLLGAAAYHTISIYAKKELLYEMQKKALPHIGITLGVGFVSGLVVGQLYSYDFKIYRKFNKVNKQLSSIHE